MLCFLFFAHFVKLHVSDAVDLISMQEYGIYFPGLFMGELQEGFEIIGLRLGHFGHRHVFPLVAFYVIGFGNAVHCFGRVVPLRGLLCEGRD